MKKTALITTLLTLAVGIWLVPSTRAADEEKEAQIKIPDTVAGILQAVSEHETELSKTITDKKLADVHHQAFAIRDLVNALPEKSNDLAAEKLARLKANAKFVAVLAGRLDQSGDAKNQAATEANFKKLQGVLKQIQSLYPAHAAKSSAAIQYTCTMHQEVVQDLPATAPSAA